MEDGQWCTIASRRGETHGKARVTTAIAKGVIYQERFWARAAGHRPRARLPRDEHQRADQERRAVQPEYGTIPCAASR
ncbi:MAG: molybdopterin dinucleotide binding domain-containing protein [Eggerthellaceae bacterium]